jgi:hypothetical protein
MITIMPKETKENRDIYLILGILWGIWILAFLLLGFLVQF